MGLRIWWLVQKDLQVERRALQMWPAMLLLGAVVVLVLSFHLEGTAQQKHAVVGGLLWLAIFFAGTLALDRSFGIEREQGCLRALLLYPVSPTTVYVAKLVANLIALSCLELIVIPLFVALADVPLLRRPGAMALVVTLGNLGFAGTGTLLAGITSGQGRVNLLALLMLPVIVPVVLAAAQATRLMLDDDLGREWWRCVQLLGSFAAIFITVGALLFEIVLEE